MTDPRGPVLVHEQVALPVKVRGVSSPLHCTVHTDVSRQSSSQLDVHTKSHSEPPSQVTLALSSIVIEQTAPLLQR